LAVAACASKPEVASPAPPVNMSARDIAASNVHVDPLVAASLISQYRKDRGLSAVMPDPALQKLAQAQADAMAAHDLLSHDIDGTLTQRFDAAQLSQATAVENVSAGYFSFPHVMDGWEQSPPHKANLLAPSMRRLGIATAFAPGTRYEVFWALDMSN
jgi:uncharacterized protein YkwD